MLFPGISALGHFVPKLRPGASAPGRSQPGLGRLPNKHFGKHFCRRPGTKILSVFTLKLLAKNASVATLALLAVSAYPGNPTKKRRQRRFLRSLRFTVFYDCIDNTLDEPQFAFVERIKLNVDPLLCGFIGSHIGVEVFVHGDTEHCYHLVKGV